MTPPGTRLRALAARVCSARTMERLIDPVVADLQVEHASAAGARGRWLARLRGYVAFAKVGLWCGVFGLGEARRNWSAEDRENLRRTLWLAGGAIALVSVPLWLMELPRTRDYLESMRDTEFPPTASVQQMMMYLLPAILPLSMPIGFAIGIAFATNRRELSRRLVGAVILAALVVSVFSFATIGWLTPRTNQLYREAVVGEFVMKGDREFTLSDLRLATSEGMRQRFAQLRMSDRYRAFTFELHQRLGIAMAPLTFCALALVLTTRRRLTLTATIAGLSVAFLSYWGMRWLGYGLSLGDSMSPQLAAWIPQVVLMAGTILVALPKGRLKAT